MSLAAPARRTLWLALYAIAMGLLEAAVVVYLRELFYPDGFRFPLVPLPARLAFLEVAREGCTVVMLVSVAVLCRTDRLDAFFVFAFLFGAWDLVYYAGLKLLLGWPASLLTWDVLFLIPLPWVGPVIAPVGVSLLFIAVFLIHTRLRSRRRILVPRPAEWASAIAGALAVIVAFCWRFRAAMTEPEPGGFPWWLFAAGIVLGAAPFVRAARRAIAERPVARS
jgi:hypothetical protein